MLLWLLQMLTCRARWFHCASHLYIYIKQALLFTFISIKKFIQIFFSRNDMLDKLDSRLTVVNTINGGFRSMGIFVSGVKLRLLG